MTATSGIFLALEFGGFAVGAFFFCVIILRGRSRWVRKRRGKLNERISIGHVLKALRQEIHFTIMSGSPVPVILGTTFLTIGIGFQLLTPADTFSSSQSYAYLDRTYANEITWGYGLVFIGIIKLLLVGYNAVEREVFYPTSLYISAIVNALLSLVWLNITLGILVSNSKGFGWIVYLGLALANLWCSARRLRQAQGGR